MIDLSHYEFCKVYEEGDVVYYEFKDDRIWLTFMHFITNLLNNGEYYQFIVDKKDNQTYITVMLDKSLLKGKE